MLQIAGRQNHWSEHEIAGPSVWFVKFSCILKVWFYKSGSYIQTSPKAADSPNAITIFLVFHTLSYCNFLISPVHVFLRTLRDLQALEVPYVVSGFIALFHNYWMHLHSILVTQLLSNIKRHSQGLPHKLDSTLEIYKPTLCHRHYGSSPISPTMAIGSAYILINEFLPLLCWLQ